MFVAYLSFADSVVGQNSYSCDQTTLGCNAAADLVVAFGAAVFGGGGDVWIVSGDAGFPDVYAPTAYSA